MNRRKPAKVYSQAAYILMTKFHWTIEEIKELPLCSVEELANWMKWEQKEIEKGSHK